MDLDTINLIFYIEVIAREPMIYPEDWTKSKSYQEISSISISNTSNQISIKNESKLIHFGSPNDFIQKNDLIILGYAGAKKLNNNPNRKYVIWYVKGDKIYGGANGIEVNLGLPPESSVKNLLFRWINQNTDKPIESAKFILSYSVSSENINN